MHHHFKSRQIIKIICTLKSYRLKDGGYFKNNNANILIEIILRRIWAVRRHIDIVTYNVALNDLFAFQAYSTNSQFSKYVLYSMKKEPGISISIQFGCCFIIIQTDIKADSGKSKQIIQSLQGLIKQLFKNSTKSLKSVNATLITTILYV